jgi:predicted secreted protein
MGDPGHIRASPQSDKLWTSVGKTVVEDGDAVLHQAKALGRAGLGKKFPAPRIPSFLLSSLFAFLTFISPVSYGSETVVVNKSFDKREIKVKVGGMIRVELEELGAAGYVWKLQNLDKDHFENPDVRTRGTPPEDDVTGAPVMKSWLIRCRKTGQSQLRFIHYRPWEDEKTASETFSLRVRIVP